MLRLTGAPDAPATWRDHAFIFATLFLNAPFWFIFASFNRLSWPPLFAAVAVATGLFYLAPALRSADGNISLSTVLDQSLGKVLAVIVRVCGIAYLIEWATELLFTSFRLYLLTKRLQLHEATQIAFLLALLAFVFVTTLQGDRVTGLLARFTVRFSIAILIVALWRVAPAWHFLPNPEDYRDLQEDVLSYSGFFLLIAPLGLIAATLRPPTSSRSDVWKIGLFGIALPLFVTSLLIDRIDEAVGHSRCYQPSLTPNIAMVLWGKASVKVLKWWFLIGQVSSLGALRFCAIAIQRLSPVRPIPRWIIAAAASVAIAFLTIRSYVYPDWPFEIASSVLVIAAGILTADWRQRQLRPDRWIDLPAVCAFAIAILVYAFVNRYWSYNSWMRPWTLPCYASALIATSIARKASRSL